MKWLVLSHIFLMYVERILSVYYVSIISSIGVNMASAYIGL